MNLNLYGAGGDLEPHLQKVRQNCGLALKADPDLELGYLEQSHALKLISESRIGKGLDPSEYLKESEDLALKALEALTAKCKSLQSNRNDSDDARTL